MSQENPVFMERPVSRRQFLAAIAVLSGSFFVHNAVHLQNQEGENLGRINALIKIKSTPQAERVSQQTDAQLDANIQELNQVLTETTTSKRWKIGGIIAAAASLFVMYREELKKIISQPDIQPTPEEILKSFPYDEALARLRVNRYIGGGQISSEDWKGLGVGSRLYQVRQRIERS